MNTKESSQNVQNQQYNPGNDLNQSEQQEVEQRINVSAIVVHETVRLEGERSLFSPYKEILSRSCSKESLLAG